KKSLILSAMIILLLAAIGLALLIDHPLLEMLQSLVYLYPLICICVGTGLWVMLQRVKHPALAIALIGGVLLLPGQHAVRAEMIGPATPQHLRPILQYIAANKQSTDAVFVWHEAVDAFRFYWHDRTGPVYLQPPEDPSVKVQFRRGDFLKQIDAAVARQGRVWLVFTHGWDDDKMSYLTRLQKYATEFEVYTLSHEHTVGDASARLLRDATHEHL
ncbi:MAG: hypothetical protein ACE5GE_04115, partial [Phycisphaerae bacterium]